MENDSQILLKDVSFTYEEAAAPALSDVCASVRPGEFVAVLGHNGSGKSTLAKLVNALYQPTEGNVVVCGYNTREDKLVWEIRRRAGMIFQNPDNQIVATVVKEDVAFGLENLGVPTEEMLPRIEKALSAVRMNKYADSAPHTLSGGQKQRVAIAGILAMEPSVGSPFSGSPISWKRLPWRTAFSSLRMGKSAPRERPLRFLTAWRRCRPCIWMFLP